MGTTIMAGLLDALQAAQAKAGLGGAAAGGGKGAADAFALLLAGQASAVPGAPAEDADTAGAPGTGAAPSFPPSPALADALATIERALSGAPEQKGKEKEETGSTAAAALAPNLASLSPALAPSSPVAADVLLAAAPAPASKTKGKPEDPTTGEEGTGLQVPASSPAPVPLLPGVATSAPLRALPGDESGNTPDSGLSARPASVPPAASFRVAPSPSLAQQGGVATSVPLEDVPGDKSGNIIAVPSASAPGAGGEEAQREGGRGGFPATVPAASSSSSSTATPRPDSSAQPVPQLIAGGVGMARPVPSRAADPSVDTVASVAASLPLFSNPNPTPPPSPTTTSAAPAAAKAADPVDAVAPAQQAPVVQQVAPSAVPVASAPAAAPAAQPLADQLIEPIVSLRAAPDGDHVVVVKVTPEHLGPVTIHAHVSRGDLDVQLFAPSADSRDALKAMLPDLRRDLGAGSVGTSTTLGLGTGDTPQQGAPREQTTGGGDRRGEQPTWSQPERWGGRDTPTREAPRPATSSTALLDVLA